MSNSTQKIDKKGVSTLSTMHLSVHHKAKTPNIPKVSTHPIAQICDSTTLAPCPENPSPLYPALPFPAVLVGLGVGVANPPIPAMILASPPLLVAVLITCNQELRS
jgi:hypothetical protein